IIWTDDAKEQRKFVLKTFKDFELNGETTEDCIHDEVTRLLDRVKEHGLSNEWCIQCSHSEHIVSYSVWGEHRA
ncbi:unnamed protein product, partial [Allacma fusca]